MSGLGRCPDLRNPDLGGSTVITYILRINIIEMRRSILVHLLIIIGAMQSGAGGANALKENGNRCRSDTLLARCKPPYLVAWAIQGRQE